MSTDPLSLEQIARRALWELSAEAAGIGIYVLHLSSGQMDMDERALALTGLTGATGPIRPEDVLARIPAEEVAGVAAAIDHAIATAGAYSAEHRMVDPDGTSRWVAVRGQTLTDDAGTTTALVGALYDITALREASTRVTEVLESMSAAFYSVDGEWRFTYVNGAAEALIGVSRHDAVGQVLWDLFPDAVGTLIEDTYRAAAASGQNASFDAYYPAPLDAWFEIRVWPTARGLSVYFIDVTASRAAQEASEVAAARLSGLAETALALVEAEDVGDLARIVAEQGLAAMGCDGGSVTVFDPEDPDILLSYVTASYGSRAQADYARLPLSTPLPVNAAAATGRTVLLPDRAASLAFSPLMDEAVTDTGLQAFACLPLRAGGQVIGVVGAGWQAPQDFDDEQVELLEAFAAQVAQALQRLRAREAEQAATAGALQAAAQQAALVDIAQALGDTDSEDAVLQIVSDRGTVLLGAQGAGLALVEPGGAQVRILVTSYFDAQLRTSVEYVPADFTLPLVRTAVTGTAFFLPDLASTTADFPAAAELHPLAHTEGSAAVPLTTQGQVFGSLAVAFADVHHWRTSEQGLLEALAALTAQALDRLAAREAERAASAATARFSETLQRSLLTSPPEPDHLQIAVRYSPAAAEAQVGGDWYDAFLTGTGTTSLVIGDVAGHDSRAAAAMGQMRNLLRGIAHAIGESPAAVLSALDRAVHDLDVTAMATIVLARVEQPPHHRAAGTRVLRWSNAGHPSPLLITPDGTARFLGADTDTDADLLIGIDPGTDRSDHTVVLEEGATVLLFTDGLVERRGASLDVGLTWLAETAGDLAHLSLDELCDELLAQVGGQVDDDVALLALRAHPEDHLRPAEAGPARDPLHTPTPTGDHAPYDWHGENGEQEDQGA